MRKSDNTYDDIETDDPVAHTEQLYRRELRDEQLRDRVKLLVGDGDEDDGRPRSVSNTVDMISDVLHSEALQSALASLVTRVLDSEQFQKGCQTLLKNLWNDLVNDPETTAQVVELLQNSIQNKEIQRAVKKLIMQIINDKEVYDELTRLIVRLGQEKAVLEATQDLLTESAHNALNDPEILDHSMEFATDVVGDDIVQRTSGEALRNTVSYAVLPGVSTVMTVVGVALLLFGVSALFNARASEHEAAIVEKAMATVARNIQTTTIEGVGAVLSLPGRLLSACWSLLSSVALLPVKLVQHGLSKMGKSGEAALSAFNGIVQYITDIPNALIRVLGASMGRAEKSVRGGTTRALEGATAAISASFAGNAYRAIAKSTNVAVSGVGAYMQSLNGLVSILGKASREISKAATVAITSTTDGLGAYVQSFEALTAVVGKTVQNAGVAPLLDSAKVVLTSVIGGASRGISDPRSVAITSATAGRDAYVHSFDALLRGIRKAIPTSVSLPKIDFKWADKFEGATSTASTTASAAVATYIQSFDALTAALGNAAATCASWMHQSSNRGK